MGGDDANGAPERRDSGEVEALEVFRDPAPDGAAGAEARGDGRDGVDPEALAELLDVPVDVTDPAADDPAPAVPRRPRRRRPRILAISGAKGGVGKTLVAGNLAVYFATVGRRVVLVDADVGGANVHTVLGLPHPSAVETAAADTDRAGDWEADEARFPGLVDTPVPGLRLLHAGRDEPARGTTRRGGLRGLGAALRKLSADWIVVDLGAGLGRDLLDFWLDADAGLFVTVPEPTAIENTYRFIRHAFARSLRRDASTPQIARHVGARLRSLGNHPAPMDLVRRLDAAGDPLADEVREAVQRFLVRFCLNETRVRADLDLGPAMRSAARRRLGVELDYVGYIDFDDTVWSTARARRPLLVESPGTKASRNIEKIARRLLATEAAQDRYATLRTVPPESHHDLLEVDRGATDEEVRRAFKRAREIYGGDALCCYGLFDGAALEALRARLEEAHDVLLDPARRRPYELSVFPPLAEPGQSPPHLIDLDEPRPPPPVILPDTEFTGALLRAVRESRGIELSEISERTKIGTSHLEAIEADAFRLLPAPVYVRGFVRELGKCLRLDPGQVSRTYMRRYRRYLEELGEGAP